jgi:hypothetical protein
MLGGLGQPGTKWGGGLGKALEGAATGLQQGAQTRALLAEAQRNQQDLALKTQQLNQQKQLNDITLGNQQILQKRIAGLPPDEQALAIADPKAYFDMDLMKKAAPASIAALQATGKFSPEAIKAFKDLDPATLHDLTSKTLDAYSAGKETDLQKVHDAILKADTRPVPQAQKEKDAWTGAAYQLKAAPQIAVTEARGEEARETKQTEGTASGTTAARTIAKLGPDGKLHIFGFNPATTNYDRDQGLAAEKGGKIDVDAATGKLIIVNADGSVVQTGVDAGTKSGVELNRLLNSGGTGAPTDGSTPAAAPSATATPAAPPPRTASASATPGPAARKAGEAVPPPSRNTPLGMGKYNPDKSKLAGMAVYDLPNGKIWGFPSGE